MSATPLPSMTQAARALVTRDLQLLWRRRGDSLQPVLFAMTVEAGPLPVGPPSRR